MAGYVGAGVPARIVRVSSTTLFQLAADYLGDPLLWTKIAQMNGLTDPWIDAITELKIPKPEPSNVTPTGILGA